jgi:hypothetical protein
VLSAADVKWHGFSVGLYVLSATNGGATTSIGKVCLWWNLGHCLERRVSEMRVCQLTTLSSFLLLLFFFTSRLWRCGVSPWPPANEAGRVLRPSLAPTRMVCGRCVWLGGGGPPGWPHRNSWWYGLVGGIVVLSLQRHRLESFSFLARHSSPPTSPTTVGLA